MAPIGTAYKIYSSGAVNGIDAAYTTISVVSILKKYSNFFCMERKYPKNRVQGIVRGLAPPVLIGSPSFPIRQHVANEIND